MGSPRRPCGIYAAGGYSSRGRDIRRSPTLLVAPAIECDGHHEIVDFSFRNKVPREARLGITNRLHR